jgi:hypothetical protein
LCFRSPGRASEAGVRPASGANQRERTNNRPEARAIWDRCLARSQYVCDPAHNRLEVMPVDRWVQLTPSVALTKNTMCPRVGRRSRSVPGVSGTFRGPRMAENLPRTGFGCIFTPFLTSTQATVWKEGTPVPRTVVALMRRKQPVGKIT